MPLQPSGRFGSALAVLDFNKDGVPDLAVGAPSVGSEKLAYTVRLPLRGETGRRGGGPGGAPVNSSSRMCRANICGEMISGPPLGVLDMTLGCLAVPSSCLPGLHLASCVSW